MSTTRRKVFYGLSPVFKVDVLAHVTSVLRYPREEDRTLVLEDPNIVTARHFYLVFTFNEVVEGLTASDFTTQNATVNSITTPCSEAHPIEDTNVRFCLKVTPSGTHGETVSVSLPANVVDGGNEASNGYTATVRRRGVSLDITGPEGPVSGAFHVNFRFNDILNFRGGDEVHLFPPNEYFKAEDLRVSNGSLPAQFPIPTTDGDEEVFRLRITPRNSFEGDFTITLPEGTVYNEEGDFNAAASWTVQVDTLRPSFTSAEVASHRLNLTYNENLNESSVPEVGDFTVVKGAAETAVELQQVTVSGQVVTLVLTSAVAASDTLKVSYTKGTHPIEDVAGNDASNLSDQTVSNSTQANTSLTGSLTIDDSTPLVGETLQADRSQLADTNGLPSNEAYYFWQWIRQEDTTGTGAEDIEGATGKSYTLTTEDDGKYIRVKMAVLDNGGYREEATSSAVGPVLTPPLAPAAPRLTPGVNSLSVAWDAPNNVGRPDIQHYKVQYRTPPLTGSWTVESDSFTGLTADISSLSPGQEYEVQVRAVNEDGEGPWSESQTTSTLVPLNVELDVGTSLGGTSAKTVTREEGGANLVITLVATTTMDIQPGFSFRMSVNQVAQTPPGADTALLTDELFEPGDFTREDTGSGVMRYRARKQVVSFVIPADDKQADGDKSFLFVLKAGANFPTEGLTFLGDELGDSGPVNGKTPVVGARLTVSDNDRVSTAPQSLAALAGAGQVNLSWTAPSDTGTSELTGYQYRQSTDGGTNWSPDWADISGSDKDTLSYSVVNLNHGTQYTFQVRAVSAGGSWSCFE